MCCFFFPSHPSHFSGEFLPILKVRLYDSVLILHLQGVYYPISPLWLHLDTIVIIKPHCLYAMMRLIVY